MSSGERIAQFAEHATNKRRELINSPDWFEDCVHGDTGKPLPVLRSVLAALRAIWPDAFAYDQMLCTPLLIRSLDGVNDFMPRPVTDDDVAIVQERLQSSD